MSVPVGPVRDALAVLSEADKGGTWASAHDLKDRTGISYSRAEQTLERMFEQGWARRRAYAGVHQYRISKEGRAKL